jgi:hypothetical protein
MAQFRMGAGIEVIHSAPSSNACYASHVPIAIPRWELLQRATGRPWTIGKRGYSCLARERQGQAAPVKSIAQGRFLSECSCSPFVRCRVAPYALSGNDCRLGSAAADSY